MGNEAPHKQVEGEIVERTFGNWLRRKFIMAVES
jgi:hypothetical protein